MVDLAKDPLRNIDITQKIVRVGVASNHWAATTTADKNAPTRTDNNITSPVTDEMAKAA